MYKDTIGFIDNQGQTYDAEFELSLEDDKIVVSDLVLHLTDEDGRIAHSFVHNESPSYRECVSYITTTWLNFYKEKVDKCLKIKKES